MQNTDFLWNKIQNFPNFSSVEAVALWLQDIEDIQLFEELDPLFEKIDSLGLEVLRNEWRGLLTIVKNKYINNKKPEHKFEEKFEEKFDETILYEPNSIYLLDEKSRNLDFSKMPGLKKIKLDLSFRCTDVIYSGNNVEMLSIGFLPKLEKIVDIDCADNLRYLDITKCNKLNDFEFIKRCKKLMYLNLSNNKMIEDISFIPTDSEIRCLHLDLKNILKNESTILHLSKMKNLSYLLITGNKAESKMLRERFPDCFVNGESPLRREM